MQNQSNLNEAKAVKRLARILFKREIAGARASKHMERMRHHRGRAFDDDHHNDHKKEFNHMERHRRASHRFAKISNGKKPFAVTESFFGRSRGEGVARILAKRHDRLANKYVYKSEGPEGKKFGIHARAAQRYSRIAAGKKPFSEEEDKS